MKKASVSTLTRIIYTGINIYVDAKFLKYASKQEPKKTSKTFLPAA